MKDNAVNFVWLYKRGHVGYRKEKWTYFRETKSYFRLVYDIKIVSWKYMNKNLWVVMEQFIFLRDYSIIISGYKESTTNGVQHLANQSELWSKI